MSIHSEIPVDIVDDGILWLINTTVFHPRGFALSMDLDTGKFKLMGDGSERWVFDEIDSVLMDKRFLAVERAFQRARENK